MVVFFLELIGFYIRENQILPHVDAWFNDFEQAPGPFTCGTACGYTTFQFDNRDSVLQDPNHSVEHFC